jgi:hypothetical protein
MRMPKLARNSSEFKINENPEKQTTWRYLHKSNEEVFPYAVESKRLLGSQFLNTHNSIISKCLACNNNVQIGSPIRGCSGEPPLLFSNTYKNRYLLIYSDFRILSQVKLMIICLSAFVFEFLVRPTGCSIYGNRGLLFD